MAMKKSKVVELFWKIHPPLYRLSKGKILGELTGMPVLLLSTKGAKSGQTRTTALTYMPHGNAYVVIGSFLGEPRHPGWVHNLRADPSASVQVRGDVIPVRGREADGEEREQIWKAVCEMQPDYGSYDDFTERKIPVVVLEPAG